MDTRTVWVYSEQELTPRASEVIQTIKEQSGFSNVKFRQLPDYNTAPKKILVFGSKAPAWAGLGSEFIYTFSIAQIMSKPNALTVVSAALRMYFGEVHEPPIGLRPRGVQFWDTPDRLGFDYNLPTVIDIETDGNLGKTHTPEDVNVISVGLYQEGMPPIVWHMPKDDPGQGTIPLYEGFREMFAEHLPRFTKAIYHNGKFDTRVLNRWLGVRLCVWFDTMLAHHVLNHAAAMHGLKELAQRYLGAPEWEAGLKQYTKGGGHYENIPSGKLVEYNGWDVYWTYQLFLLFKPQIETDELNETAFMFEMQVADFLLDVESNGLPFNESAATNIAVNQELIMIRCKTALAVLVKDPLFNPNSPQQVKKALAAVGIRVSSTNEETIDGVKEFYTKSEWVQSFCSLLIEYRKASKVKGTYAEGWMKTARAGRVHPTFMVHGTSTGRLSSRAPNAQNMPRDKMIRKIVSV